MATRTQTTPSIAKSTIALLGASLITAGFILCATIVEGLQFADSNGWPQVTDIVLFVLLFLFFATPVVATLVFPIGAALLWGLSRFGLLNLWMLLPLSGLIGYGASWLVPFLPDIVLASQITSPVREIAMTTGGVCAGLVFWLLARPDLNRDRA
ncbi:MAG: hypothetical protein DHS20C06_15450 [Hyphobacterium sp.]|nr:MAG: hypothetical protein DHS20C06_15450 [Hyphobacterium sp.]